MRLQIVATLAGRVFRVGAGVLVAVITARFLGPEGRGEYFLVLTLAATIAQFGNLGLHSSNTYLVARDRGLLARLVANSFWVSIAAGGGLAAIVVGASYALDLFGGPGNTALWFVAVLAPLSLFFLLGQNLLLGIGRTFLFNLVEILSSAVIVALQLAAGFFVPTSAGFLAARSIGLIASSAWLLGALTRGSTFRPSFYGETFRAGFTYAMRAYLIAVLGYLVLRANIFLLELLRGFGELGVYSVATQIADALEIIPTSVGLVLFPRLLRGGDLKWQMTKTALLYVVGAMAIVCVSVALVSEPFIRFVFGDEFVRAASMLRLLLPQVFFIACTSVVSQYLAALGIPSTLLGIWLVGLIVATAFGLLLIPTFGGDGAALALSLTYAIIFVSILVLARAQRHDT